MRSDTLLRTTALFALGGLFAMGAPAQQSPDQQPTDAVADAARKARSDKQTAPKPKKVYTDDDFASSAKPATAAKTDGSEQPAADQTTTNANGAKGVKPEDDPKSEAYWRKHFKDLRAKMDQAQTELDVLQRELDKDQVQYYTDPQKALMQQNNRSDINEKTAKVDAKKKEIDGYKQQLSDMEDAMRKAGGDPGWAR